MGMSEPLVVVSVKRGCAYYGGSVEPLVKVSC